MRQIDPLTTSFGPLIMSGTEQRGSIFRVGGKLAKKQIQPGLKVVLVEERVKTTTRNGRTYPVAPH